MFALGLEAQLQGRGVVGSTSDILGYIERRTRAAIASGTPQRCSFVLGTEAGMVTSIVRKVRALVEAQARPDVEVEIIFPVSDAAVAATACSRPALSSISRPRAFERCRQCH